VKTRYPGSARSTRRAVNAAKTAWKAGKRRTYRPWIPEPGAAGCTSTWERVLASTAGGPGCSARGCPGPVSGWSPGVGLHPGNPGRLPGHHVASDRRGPDLSSDRQREGDHCRAHRRDPGPASADGRREPALRLPSGQLRPLRPRVQGRRGGHGPHREGRPGAHGREPAARLWLIRRARRRLPP
jgi:hypothetical protein